VCILYTASTRRCRLLQDAGLMHHRCQIWLTGYQGLQRKYVVRDGLAAAAAAAAAAA
jgi:hypothetical protein